MTTHFSLFDPKLFLKQSLKAVGMGSATALIPFALASFATPFVPPEHIGFPPASMGDNLMSVVQTGDLLFFNQPQFIPRPVKWFFSQLQKAANFSEFEQMGVIVWNPKKQYPYVIEKTLVGTLATPFEDRIGWSKSQDVLLRTLHLFRTPEFQHNAQSFVDGELKLNDPETEGALTRSLRWAMLFRSLLGTWVRDYSLPRSKPGVTGGFHMHTTEEIANLQYSNNPFEKEQYQQLVGTTSKRGNVTKYEQAPLNRVLKYAEVVGTLKVLRNTETQLQEHLHAERSRLEYERALHAYERSELTSSNKSKLSTALDDAMDRTNQLTTTPTRPPNLHQELHKKDLMLLLQKRELLYDDFEKQYDSYRNDTILLARWGLYRPLNDNTTPAFPSTDMITRLYQHLNIIPKSPHPKLSPIDVEALFPPSLPGLENSERRDEFDLRKFNFGKAFEQLTEFAPTSLEYRPFNYRQQNPMFISQGLLGDEQFIIQGFNKPPIEYRTGPLSTPQESKR